MKLPKDKNLRRILAAQLPADFADWLDYVAVISLFTYVWAVDPVYFAIFALAFALPYLVIGPMAGALVDRHDLKTIMVWSNLGRALSTFALAFAGQPEIVLAIVFLRASIDSFFSPAKQASIQALAEKSELMATNSVSQVINQVSKLAGPAVGGAILLFASSQTVFLVNGCVSLVALLILLTLPKKLRANDEQSNEQNEKRGMFADLRDGYQTVMRKRSLWFTILFGSVGFFAIFLHDTLIGPATKQMGFDQSILGLSITAVGAGGAIGALLVGMIKKQPHPYLLMASGMMVASGFTVLLGYALYTEWSVPMWLYVTAFFTVGVASAAIFIPMRTIFQLETPPEKIGRVTALNEAMNVLAIMGAPFIGAVLATTYGLGVPFLIGGGLSIFIALIAFALIRAIPISMEDKEEAAEPELSK